MVRVDDNLVLAPAEAVDTLVDLVEGDVKMTRVTARRLEPEPGISDDACLHQREPAEADERSLLRHLIQYLSTARVRLGLSEARERLIYQDYFSCIGRDT